MTGVNKPKADKKFPLHKFRLRKREVISALFIVVLSIGAWSYFYINSMKAKKDPIDFIGNFLEEREHVQLPLFRSDISPGAVLNVIDGIGVEVPASDYPGPIISKSINVESKVSLSRNGAGSLELQTGVEANASAGQDGIIEIEIHLKGVTSHGLSLREIRNLYQSDDRLSEWILNARASERNQRLIVWETTRVDEILIFLNRDDSAVMSSGLSEDELSAIFGAKVKRLEETKYKVSGPIVIGAKLAKPYLVATSLGGGVQELSLSQINQNQFDQLALPYPESEFQIKSFAVSLGNYPEAADPKDPQWFEGPLADSNYNLEVVTRAISKLSQSGSTKNHQSISSRQDARGEFDIHNRLTKDQIYREIDRFVEEAIGSFDHTKETVILFYLFGHGFAGKQNGEVYIAPEAYVPKFSGAMTTQMLLEEIDQFILLSEIIEKLEKASDQLVIMVDTCRTSDPDGQEILIKDQLTDQVLNDLISEISDIFDFMTGLYGPHPVLLSSPPGGKALTVETNDNIPKRIGMIAARLEQVIKEWQMTPDSLTIKNFIDRILLASSYNNQRLYITTHLEERFHSRLSDALLLTENSDGSSDRSTPFQAEVPFQLPKASSQAPELITLMSGISGVEWSVISGEQLFFTTTEGVFEKTVTGLKPVYSPESFFSGQLAASDGILYIFDEIEGKFFTFEKGVGLFDLDLGNQVEYPTGIFTNPYSGRTLILSDDSTYETPDPLFLLDGQELRLLDYSFDYSLPDILVEYETDAFAWLNTYFENSLYQMISHNDKDFTTIQRLANLPDPTNLAFSNKHFYILANENQLIIRSPINIESEDLKAMNLKESIKKAGLGGKSYISAFQFLPEKPAILIGFEDTICLLPLDKEEGWMDYE